MSRKLEIVMYHYVRDLKNSRYSEIKGLDSRLFRQQLNYFQQNYHFISTEQILTALEQNGPIEQNAILLSFDDGYSDHYNTVFPLFMQNDIKGLFAMPAKILKEQKMLDVNRIHFILASTPIEKIKEMIFSQLNHYRGAEYILPDNDEIYHRLAIASRFDAADTIFVKRLLQNYLEESLRNKITDHLFQELVSDNEKAFVSELYLSWDQIKLMKKCGMFFALHGYEHYWFDKLSEKEYKQDVQKALEVFDGIIDPQRWVFCYPYGATQPGLLEYCSANGCVAGVTTEPRAADLDQDSPLLLPRFDTNDYPPKAAIPKSKLR